MPELAELVAADPALKKWVALKYHAPQQGVINSLADVIVVAAGRRSGKTEILKRRIIRACLSPPPGITNARYVVAAPTFTQAKKIYWADLKAMSPRFAVRHISESELSITYITGARAEVLGMDRPERVEGAPLDGIGMDEYANMHERAWDEHVYPALSTLGRPQGWAMLIGVPEGCNHFYDLYTRAAKGDDPSWAAFTWKSEDILPPHVIAAAKRSLDRLTYQQEYEAEFVTFEGRAYYEFNRHQHAKKALHYDPSLDLVLCFDFNRNPGVCAIAQEHARPIPQGMTQHDWARLPNYARSVTHFLKEIFIPRNSNTVRVCEALLDIDFIQSHTHSVDCYGDATGGAGGSAKTEGSDWELIRKKLGKHFLDRLHFRYPTHNPPQRTRINAMNSRLKATDGTISCYVDPRCEHLIKDFEGVSVIKGTSGEIDKNINPELTHISDAAGYYIAQRFPISGGMVVQEAY